MAKSRREFLTETSMGLLGAAALGSASGDAVSAQTPTPSQEPAGAPPAFGAGPGVGPEVSPATLTEAEKLVQVQLQEEERAMAAASWRRTMAGYLERRTGPRKVTIEDSVAPYSNWNPVLPGRTAGPARDRFVRSKRRSGAAAGERRGHRFRAGDEAFALDRDSAS